MHFRTCTICLATLLLFRLVRAEPAECAAVGQPTVVYARTGADFIRGIVNPSVVEVFIVVPKLVLQESDFDGVRVPLQLTRSLNITGSPDLPGRALLDFSLQVEKPELQFLKIEFRAGCTVIYHRVIVVTGAGATSLLSSSPGLDIFIPRATSSTADGASDGGQSVASAAPTAPAVVVLSEVAYTFWMCMPPETLLTSAAKYTRPADQPGSQNAQLTLGSSQAGCDNATQSKFFPDEASLMTRCWAQRVDYIDVIVEATTPDSTLGQDVSAGYIVKLLNTTGLCEEEMQRECIQQFGVASCQTIAYARLERSQHKNDSAEANVSQASPPVTGSASEAPPVPVPVDATISQDGLIQASNNGSISLRKDSSGRGALIGSVLGGVLGGAAALVIIIVAGVLWRARKLREEQRSQLSGSKLDYPSNSDDLESAPRKPSLSELKSHAGVDTDTESAGDSGKAKHESPETTEETALGSATVTVQQDSTDASELGGNVQRRVQDPSPPVTDRTKRRPSLQLDDPQVVDELVLLPNVLGQGTFGRVVEGTLRGERVAVKLMPSELLASADNFTLPKTFLQEVEILGRCAHPNVVRLLAVNLRPPRPCLVMELMETSLARLIRRGEGDAGLLPMPKVLHIAIEVARGLEYLHPTITHRDLKPANVLLSGAEGPRPTVKLADFGLSRLRATAAPTKHPEAGTPAYMAPECFDTVNSIVTFRADMFSFGCLLWALLAGQEPWAGLDPVAIATMLVVHGRRPPLYGLPRSRCPHKVARLLEGCWEADPMRRPAAAEAVKVLLLAMEGCDTDA